MNIKEAKQEIIRTIRAYRRKDETGLYEISPEMQRPVLLMGPPGIGKTAIMEQIARECGILLVSYTITHHTRQSAVGLPVISHRTFGTKEYAVTEYTMSEIVASVYERIEQTGISEGILFLDEINCVSETLAPAMLRFLQYKTFGTHKIPDGWIIVAAGNPVQYNRSAREFDIVTLDRVKRMDIETDLEVWKEYASKADVHGAILSYLTLRPQNFYVIRTELSGRYFVTARGWEDLSRMLKSYERMGEPVTEQMAVQYLQDPEIARDFVLYYDLYRKYKEVYHVSEILDGAPVKDPDMLKGIPFDEKLSLIRLLSDSLHDEFRKAAEALKVQEILYEWLSGMKNEGLSAAEDFEEAGERMKEEYIGKKEAGMLAPDEIRAGALGLAAWEELLKNIRGAAMKGRYSGSGDVMKKQGSDYEDALEKQGSAHEDALEKQDSAHEDALEKQSSAHEDALEKQDSAHEDTLEKKSPDSDNTGTEQAHGTEKAGKKENGSDVSRKWFNCREEARIHSTEMTDMHLTNAFSFLYQIYGTGQEIVMLLTALNTDAYCLKFIEEYGNEAYDRYSQLLLLQDRCESIRREILRV